MSATFFSQFLMITDISTLISIASLIIIFFVIKKLSKKLNFTKLMTTSTIIGILLGIGIQYMAKFPSDPSKVTWLIEVDKWYALFGYGFMDMLKMLVDL